MWSVGGRWLWVCVLVASGAGLALMLRGPAHGQLSYTPDTRYLHWTTTYPAVTVCETLVPSATQKKITRIRPTLMQPLNYNYQRHLTKLMLGQGACTKELCVPCGPTVACDVPWRQIVEEIRKNCNDLISVCSFNGAEFPCCERFRMVDGENGPCYSFNTLQNKESTEESLVIVNSTTGPGQMSFHLLADAMIFVHSPEELATNQLDRKFQFDIKIREKNRVELLFSIVEIQNDPLLKFEDINVRGCRYLNEVPRIPLHDYPVYSYGACTLAQSTRDSFDQCGCIHPARDLNYQNMYCNYTGLNCLITFEANKKNLVIDKPTAREQCLPSCLESELTMIHTFQTWVSDDAVEGAMVTIRMTSLPTLRYERNLLRTNLDLVVSIGGTVGLFFGASLLSLAEIFYLLSRKLN
ncbi:sodium channel protein Nach-like isoform X2 [Choristoneura fumiferana]|uniref:sodium channel protein Nach-like isoform X2 n=1 Tax=Choristoneura fumiferana TaxID=7141 RepID=UPI003D15CA5E